MKYTNFDDWFDNEVLPINPRLEDIRPLCFSCYSQGCYQKAEENFEESKKFFLRVICIYIFGLIILLYDISSTYYLFG